jgi:hypothetical protein
MIQEIIKASSKPGCIPDKCLMNHDQFKNLKEEMSDYLQYPCKTKGNFVCGFKIVICETTGLHFSYFKKH